jgi:hypothetical protein
MKINITHRCGHEHRHTCFASATETERLRKIMAGALCPDCAKLEQWRANRKRMAAAAEK